ncbi:sensor histidine kinase [Salidesulfovibrio onnuriiensis]|uniref:sensor histidine kinase n=1 Tax=Salidesulfovibrio onnuriiensis TaxID=2583823 RepID=UPI0011CCB563|nr:PAS domain-containing sensor histidine kinase [Salidesulfovibrio onnuriiensis]
MELIVIASTILQFLAGFLALRLIASTERRWAWALLSAGIFSMAFRRTHTLYEIYRSGDVPELSYEILGLVISLLVFFGIYFIGPLLRDMKEAARKLARSEERYRTVAMFTHDWEYWLSPEGEYLYVSPACKDICGYAPEDFFRDPLLMNRLIHPDDREGVTMRMAALENMRKPMDFDCRIVDRDGNTRWIAHNSLPVESEQGVFLGVRASVRDISGRKQLETELRESRALYRGLVENSLSMVFRLDASGTVAFANGFAIEHLGVSESDLLGKGLREVFALGGKDLSETAQLKIDTFLATGKPLELETEIPRPDGVAQWSEWIGSAIRDSLGDICGFTCVGIDVTRRKALDKLKEDVSRIVRHDLKSPLSGIIGIPRVLREDENLTPRQVELLKTVEDAGTIMLDLVNQSLNLYKLETGTYDFEKIEFDLLELLQGIVEHLQIGRDRAIDIHVTFDGAPPDGNVVLLCADRPLVFAMFSNLMKNAVEASEGQPVTVDVQVEAECRVSIHNAGVVPASIRRNFFDKYVTEGKSGGTGLGTYSSRLIARQHGGGIEMRSTESKGTTVTVRLPWEDSCNAPVE